MFNVIFDTPKQDVYDTHLSPTIELPTYTTDIHEIQQHLSLDADSIKKLINIDRGASNAYQKTLGLNCVVKNQESYIFNHGVFHPVKDMYPLDLEEQALHPRLAVIPPHLEIEAKWDMTLTDDCENLFGDTVRLFVNQSLLTIPKVEATEETLAYYGAMIIPEDRPIRFPGSEFPIFRMSIGENWFSEGCQSEKFGGVFLEYHRDQPHFHMVYDKESYYLLAKWSDLSQTKLQITAFELPPKKGIYTKKGAIHCDSGIKGDLLVGYMISHDFSVAFLRNEVSQKAHVKVKIG